MTQQFAALSECMADECPLVRAAAVAGAAQAAAVACTAQASGSSIVAGVACKQAGETSLAWICLALSAAFLDGDDGMEMIKPVWAMKWFFIVFFYEQ
eukprot:44671-Pelagomonas_calceolata.AAC.3